MRLRRWDKVGREWEEDERRVDSGWNQGGWNKGGWKEGGMKVGGMRVEKGGWDEVYCGKIRNDMK